MSNNEAPTDLWADKIRSLAAEQDLSEAPLLKGKILSIKLGYNPNSSSIGSVVSILLWGSAFGAMAINVIAAILARNKALPPGQDEEEPES